jgi:hypothetical protein
LLTSSAAKADQEAAAKRLAELNLDLRIIMRVLVLPMEWTTDDRS